MAGGRTRKREAVNVRGLILGSLGGLVFAGSSLLLAEMAIWGWSPNVQVPDYMLCVGTVYGLCVGLIGSQAGMRYL